MAEVVSHLDLLDRVCRKYGWALLLTAEYQRRFGALGQARKDATMLEHLDVVEPDPVHARSRRENLLSGDLIARVSVDTDGNLERAARLLLDALSENHLIDAEAA